MQPSTHDNEPWMNRAIESVNSQPDEIKIPALNLMFLWQRPGPATDIPAWFDSSPPEQRFRVFELVFGKLAPAFEYLFNWRAQLPSAWRHARLGIRPFPIRASGSASFTNQHFHKSLQESHRALGPIVEQLVWPPAKIEGEGFLGIAASLPGMDDLLHNMIQYSRDCPILPDGTAPIAYQLAQCNKPEAWDALADLLTRLARPNLPLSFPAFLDELLQHTLGAARRVVETSCRIFPPKSLYNLPWYKGFLDDTARIAALQNDDVHAILPFVYAEASIDARALEPIAPRLLDQPDPQCRNAAITAYSALGPLGVPTPLKLLGDDQLKLAARAAVRGYFSDASPALASALARLFERVDSPEKTFCDDFEGDCTPFSRSVVLHYHFFQALGSDPLDPLAPLLPYLSHFDLGEILERLATREELTTLETDLLGWLAASRSQDIRASARAALAARQLDIDSTVAQAKRRLKPFLKKPRKPKPAGLGPWRTLLERTATRHGQSLDSAPPATPEAISALETQLHLTLPADLRALYLETDGCGFDGAEKLSPIDELADFTLQARTENAETDRHCNLDGILFVVDLGTGDFIGVRTVPAPVKFPGDVVRFNHETCVLLPIATNLETYLKQSDNE